MARSSSQKIWSSSPGRGEKPALPGSRGCRASVAPDRTRRRSPGKSGAVQAFGFIHFHGMPASFCKGGFSLFPPDSLIGRSSKSCDRDPLTTGKQMQQKEVELWQNEYPLLARPCRHGRAAKRGIALIAVVNDFEFELESETNASALAPCGSCLQAVKVTQCATGTGSAWELRLALAGRPPMCTDELPPKA